MGILRLDKACQVAKEAGLDLVLVAENTDPPVCRVMDFGKLCYEQKKKQKDQRKHHVTQKVKEVKFRLNIDPHDYGYKIKHAVDFLDEGCKLKVTLMFKGREMAHTEIGFELIKRIIEDLKEKGVAESSPKLFGKNICVTFTPKGHHH